ncbi:hypothetical protein C8R46DRAFT_1231843 [Mycena filopes]|nr:hypothetical protein C8R46DRAFT_1231843 [Mycena filopes]
MVDSTSLLRKFSYLFRKARKASRVRKARKAGGRPETDRFEDEPITIHRGADGSSGYGPHVTMSFHNSSVTLTVSGGTGGTGGYGVHIGGAGGTGGGPRITVTGTRHTMPSVSDGGDRNITDVHAHGIAATPCTVPQ